MARYDNCILYSNKKCTDCGECDKCDLNPNKLCDSCGKCLKEDTYDTKSVTVDEILEDEESFIKKENTYTEEDMSKEFLLDNLEKEEDINIEFIDDIDGLRDILEDKRKSAEYTYEEFPGLIRIRSKDKE